MSNVNGPTTSRFAANIDNKTETDNFENFELSEKTFSSIFNNIKPCEYFFPKNIQFNQTKNVFLLHLNIRSLEKNFDDLYQFLITLTNQPHVISISETKIKDMPLSNISIPGYNFLHVNSCTNSGGVGVYISNAFQNRKINLNINSDYSGCEDIWISITPPWL